MAKKGQYSYFDLKAAADKKSRGNWVLNLGEGVDPITVKPISVKKAVKADRGMTSMEQLEYALGDEQWTRLLEVTGDEEFGVLEEVLRSYSEHFFGDADQVPGGKEQSSI